MDTLRVCGAGTTPIRSSGSSSSSGSISSSSSSVSVTRRSASFSSKKFHRPRTASFGYRPDRPFISSKNSIDSTVPVSAHCHFGGQLQRIFKHALLGLAPSKFIYFIHSLSLIGLGQFRFTSTICAAFTKSATRSSAVFSQKCRFLFNISLSSADSLSAGHGIIPAGPFWPSYTPRDRLHIPVMVRSWANVPQHIQAQRRLFFYPFRYAIKICVGNKAVGQKISGASLCAVPSIACAGRSSCVRARVAAGFSRSSGMRASVVSCSYTLRARAVKSALASLRRLSSGYQAFGQSADVLIAFMARSIFAGSPPPRQQTVCGRPYHSDRVLHRAAQKCALRFSALSMACCSASGPFSRT